MRLRPSFQPRTMVLWVVMLLATCATVAAQTSIWHPVQVPFPQRAGNLLAAIDADSPTDVWAVGLSALHFDGNTWTPLAIRGTGVTLNGVTVISAADVWGAGEFQDQGGIVHPSLQHFDGTRWVSVASFDPGAGLSLSAIDAISSTDVWAAGWIVDVACDCIQDFVEHWNGSKWVALSVPFLSGSHFLQGIVARSSSDIWVVGYQSLNGELDGQAETMHWNGTAWSVVTVQSAPRSRFNAVAAFAANDVWAIGITNQTTLAQHWDGASWKTVSTPSTSDVNNNLFGMAGIASNNLWAVGQHYSDSASIKPLILHWDGTQWTLSNAPLVGKSDTLFDAVGFASGEVWLAGTWINNKLPIFKPLILFTNQGQ
ncbi:MAG: hypothetical protein LAN83_00615 [Acidobacteriia bacterium]|nr:hypothetical protein [Terriglobia bacterium]